MRKCSLCLGAMLLLSGAMISAGAQYRPQGPPPPSQGGSGWRYDGGPGRWDPSWDRRPNPNRGACFYTDANFQGHHFCVSAGDRVPRLPGNIGDNISSIQTFGGARVRVFDDRDYRGMNASFRGDVPALQNVPSRPGHTWNNRISSVVVQ